MSPGNYVRDEDLDGGPTAATPDSSDSAGGEGTMARERKIKEWNTSAAWAQFCAEFEPTLQKIARKFVEDPDLREDACQNARVAIYQIFPDRDIQQLQTPGLTPEQRMHAIKKFVSNITRNRCISTVTSRSEGDWSKGISRLVYDPVTGARSKRIFPPRFESLDELTDEFGMQVDIQGNISWPEVSEEGLQSPSGTPIRQRDDFRDAEEQDGDDLAPFVAYDRAEA